jgi:O-antigen/teichoic acid export membrane protein
MTVNVVASVIAFCVNAGINFFLTPYLVKSLGTESYGFISLANNFIQYGSIITAALNSMSGRFISVAYHKGDKKKASQIFSSVLVADLILAAVLLVGTSIFTAYIDLFLEIPKDILSGVQITFAIAFVTFVLSVVTAIFTTATYVKNRIDINSVRDIISNVIKVAVIVVLFTFFPVKIYYISIAALAAGVFLLIANVGVKKRILPDVNVSLRNFRLGYVKTVLFAGIWMSVIQLSNILISEVDLLVCNLTLGATLMGILSISKTIPHCIGSLISTLGTTFAPGYAVLYAKEDKQGLIEQVKFTTKILSIILTVPLAGFMVFGKEFYTLWQPTKTPEEITMIQVLSVLGCIMYLFTAHTQCIIVMFSVCNKIKLPALVSFTIGVLSIAVVLVAIYVLGVGDNGVYFIAGVSSLLMSIRAALFVPLYGSHILKCKKRTFYPPIIRGWVAFFAMVLLFVIIKQFVVVTSWVSFIGVCVGAGLIGYFISLFIFFNKDEMASLKAMIKRKFSK